jgi:5'-nucleotidase
MTPRFRRVPNIAFAALAGALAVAALSGLGLTTTDAFATGACTETITGAHSGTLTLSGPGTTCLKNATQDGAITVMNGHELSVVDSKIYGAVTSTSSAPFTFCHSSTVRGALKVSNSMNLLLIGDNGSACPANVIDGAVTMDSNTGGVQLGGNSIAGAVTANANIAPSGTIIQNNHIGGKLTCTANIPAPVNSGQANTVSGDRVGQTCASGTF